MTSLEMESPSLADTKTGAGVDTDTCRTSTGETALQAAWHRGPRLLIVLASWLVRIEHRMRQREIPVGWDAVLSLQLDRLTDIRERLDEYLGSERRRP